MSPTPVACPHCGQTLPPPGPPGLALRGKRAALYEAVRRAGPRGIDQERLFMAIYGDDPDGGPDGGIATMQSFICVTNRALRRHGQVIRTPGSGQAQGGGRHNYVLVNLKEENKP